MLVGVCTWWRDLVKQLEFSLNEMFRYRLAHSNLFSAIHVTLAEPSHCNRSIFHSWHSAGTRKRAAPERNRRFITALGASWIIMSCIYKAPKHATALQSEPKEKMLWLYRVCGEVAEGAIDLEIDLRSRERGYPGELQLRWLKAVRSLCLNRYSGGGTGNHCQISSAGS